MLVGFTRNARPYLWVGAVAITISLVFITVLASLPSPAEAAKGGTCAAFSVTTGGTTYRGDQTRTIPADRVGDRIRVDGKYIEFSVRSRDFAVLNYRHTGIDSPDADRNLPIGPAGTTIFESKVPLHGKTLSSGVSLDLNNEGVVLQRGTPTKRWRSGHEDLGQGQPTRRTLPDGA